MTKRQVFHLRPDGERAFGYAQAVRIGDSLHISGAMPVTETMEVRHPGDVAAQMALVYEDLRLTLARFGLDFKHVVREAIYTTDMAAMLAANAVRIGYFQDGHLPATTAIEVKGFAFPGQTIEVALEARADLDVNSAPEEVSGPGR